MSTTALDDSITKAITTHEEWIARLRTVISNGGSDLDARKVGRADECDFGKWLDSRSTRAKGSARWAELGELHARFHDATARVVALVDERRRADAIASVRPGGEFSHAANDLLNALRKWAGET
jgi:hypothetical protein